MCLSLPVGGHVGGGPGARHAGSVTSFLKVHSTAGRSNVEMADIGGIFKQGLPQYEFEHAVFFFKNLSGFEFQVS